MKLKGIISFISFVLLTLNCTLIEPTCLIIQNNSDYSIEISLNKGNKKELIIEDGKGDFVLVYPGLLDLDIRIKEIGFNKIYQIDIGYIEKKKFIFELK